MAIAGSLYDKWGNKMLNNQICAIIVTYNPNIDRLSRSIRAILPNRKIIKLIIVDNNSKNFGLIKKLGRYKRVRIIKLKDNLGIAKAINIGIKEIKRSKWILTLDQDTILKHDAIDTILKDYEELPKQIKDKTAIVHINYEKLGNRLVDKIFNKLRVICELPNFYLVNSVIQSGMLIKFNIAKRFHFREDLFIDQVDREYCSQITEKKFLILESKKILSNHQLGKIKKIKGKLIRFENETRLKYFTRNSAYLLKKGKLPLFEYIFKIAILYKKFILANGFGAIPKLAGIYISCTLDGIKERMSKTYKI